MNIMLSTISIETLQEFRDKFEHFATSSMMGVIPTIEYYIDYEGPPSLMIQINQDGEFVTNINMPQDDKSSFVEDFERNQFFKFLKETRKPFLIEIVINKREVVCLSTLEYTELKKNIKKRGFNE